MAAPAQAASDLAPSEPSLREGQGWYRAAIAVILLIAIARIASTYAEFTATFDEPFHIACGMQLLRQGIYTIELQHPPLARMMDALGPYLAGLRAPESGDAVQLGNGILHDSGPYERNLALARLGTLPFFLLACAVVWLWTNRLAGRGAAFVALLVFTLLPAVLAHAALATTDMACAATIALALYCFDLWIQNPSRKRSLLFGAATGLAVASKFSALLFLPACFGAWLLVSRRVRLRGLGIGFLAAWFVIWAGYRFSMEPVVGPPPHPAIDRLLHRVPAVQRAADKILQLPVPAGQFPRSVFELEAHAKGGHTSFFLGEWRKRGWWYYFPIVFLLKTPPAFLLLVCFWRVGPASGAVAAPAGFSPRGAWRWSDCCSSQRSAPLVFAAAILLASLFGHINIGSRHILAIYPLLSIAAGCAAWKFWRGALLYRIAAAAAVLSLAASSALAHPNYLSYFNFLAGSHPERIEVDSDLDWGQDLAGLAKWLRTHGVGEVSISYFGTADLARADLPVFHELQPYERVTGWVAISAYNRALPAPFTTAKVPGRAAYYAIPSNFESLRHTEGPFAWMTRYTPVAKIGSSIFVYHIAPL